MADFVSNTSVPAVTGNNTNEGTGVFGQSRSDWDTVGWNGTNVGIRGKSEEYIGIWAESGSPSLFML
ncbi:hypothetical protein [Bacillus thuringiensis]|uniref:hypothetical protein n=1 Tax=Bacillus thuringiensis TaxID=1428 RepID=UPI000CD98325|nr:hypothetical protein [Bacillus thuringiensis]QFQ28597.1 hypothetical protein DDE73_28440 [Bacillus thuringiensis]